jgi:hypothetical protein
MNIFMGVCENGVLAKDTPIWMGIDSRSFTRELDKEIIHDDKVAFYSQDKEKVQEWIDKHNNKQYEKIVLEVLLEDKDKLLDFVKNNIKTR